MAVQLQSGIPIPMMLGWFVSNASEGLIGATIIRRYITGPLHFESFRQVSVFVAAAFAGTALSSFLDAGFVTLVGWGPAAYWAVWFTRTPSNLLASLTLVPVIVTWAHARRPFFRAASAPHYVEAGLLTAGLLAVCLAVFGGLGGRPVRSQRNQYLSPAGRRVGYLGSGQRTWSFCEPVAGGECPLHSAFSYRHFDSTPDLGCRDVRAGACRIGFARQ
jgi:hypothetical protein